MSSSRGTAPVVAVALLTLTAVVAAAAVGSAAMAAAPKEAGGFGHVTLAASANASAQRVALTHRSGPALAVRELRVVVRIDGEPLAHQPPVPFFAARGFRAGPTGPFNPAGTTTWRAGSTATLRLASTNEPRLTPGATVRVELYRAELRVGTATAEA